MYLDKRHPAPMYLQLKELLKSKIAAGELQPHQQLPSERELGLLHNLSRMTVHHALQALVVEGYAYTRQGKGTYALIQPIDRSRDTSMMAEMPDTETINARWQTMKEAFLNFDLPQIERSLDIVFAYHTPEIVSYMIFPALLSEISQLVSARKAPAAVEHFAGSIIRNKLVALLSAATAPAGAKLVLTACAPNDSREIGLLTIAFNLARRGYGTIYLGQTPGDEVILNSIQLARPQLVYLNADMLTGARRVQGLFAQLLQMSDPRPILTFGGTAFSRHPSLAKVIPGTYTGGKPEQAIVTITNLLPAGQPTVNLEGVSL
jgi:DNA-binding transcriptional regulator YhcF (GntR family)